jgi:hypothetical protein
VIEMLRDCLVKETGQCDCDETTGCNFDAMTDEEIDAELHDKAWAKD